MPYLNEYAARIHDPDKYGDNLNRKNNEFGRGIDVIYGTVNDKTEIQAIRFKTSIFKAIEQVKDWLDKHNHKAISIEKPKNEDTANDYQRFVHFDIADMSMTKTSEGFLKGVVKVTKIGVFQYRNADGSIRKELRHPNDVFSYNSLQSLKMIPITDLHPVEGYVTVDN